MCEFFTKATRRRFGRVRGFKQKFFACNADLHDKLCAYAKAPRRESALDSCLRPASTPPPAGMMWDAGWNVTTDTYRVLGDIDAKVICSLRRSSLDRALSKAVQVVFHASCGVSNAVLKSERECLDALKRRGVALDVALVVRVMREAELAAQYNRAVCEAQARRTPVFFLWYEDLLRDPEPTFDALQRFLGVEPRRLKTRAQRIVSDGEDSSKWISNLKEVKAAAAAAAEADAREGTAATCAGR